MKQIKFKSSSKKRFELFDAIFNTGHLGSAWEWLEDRKIILDDLTDKDIDAIAKGLNEIKTT